MIETFLSTDPILKHLGGARDTTTTHGSLQTGFAVRPMTLWDIPTVIAFLRRFPSIHFLEWEDERLLAQVLTQYPISSFLAQDGKRLIGAVIGGAIGLRGTINHIAVDAQYQGQGVGQLLVSHTLASFQAAGIYRVFLFVLRDQPMALRFWEEAGFRATAEELTLERDL